MRELMELPGRRRSAHAHLLHIGQTVGGAEEFAQIHAGRERLAGAGQHQHFDAIVDFERVEHLDHLVIERRAHAIALLRAIERHPGDAVLDLDFDVLAPRQIVGHFEYSSSLGFLVKTWSQVDTGKPLLQHFAR
jgi:hypothetical protein